MEHNQLATEATRSHGAANGMASALFPAALPTVPMSDELLRLVVESATDFAIIASDASGAITVWNAGAERLFGHTEAEAIGQGIALIFTPEDRAGSLPAAEQALALRDGSAKDERWHLRRDGTRFWGSGLMMPLAAPGAGFVKIVRDRTEQRLTEERLREGEARFRTLAVSLPALVFRCTGDGARTWPSPQWVAYTGLSEADSLAFGWLEAVHPDDRAATLGAWRRIEAACRRAAGAGAAGTGEAGAGAEAGEPGSNLGEYYVEHRIRHAPEGRYRWHQTRAVPIFTPGSKGKGSGAAVEWVGSSSDVDDMHALQTQLAHTEWHLRSLVEGMPQLLWRSCDLGRWTWASPQWLEFTGLLQEGSHGRGWTVAVHPDDLSVVERAWEEARPHGMLDVEFRVRRASDGAYLWHRTRSLPQRDADGRIVEWLGSTTDIQDLKSLQEQQQALVTGMQDHAAALEAEIRERERVEAQLLFTAFHDDLTRLRNRAWFMDRVRDALGRARDGGAGQGCAVLFIDLDRFKLVNDSLGHQAGDRLLVEAAQRLQACAGPGDTLARLGGDEFALLVGGVPDAEAALAAARRIIAAMRHPVWIGPQEVFSSCSIGVVVAAPHHAGPEDLLRDADVAMYHAKQNDPGGCAVFTPAMRSRAVQALEMQTDLRNAVARGEFHLHYQPIVDAATRAITGVEALLRWQHPLRGAVPPAEFIPAAEETGLIREIGRWVMRDACAQMGRWLRAFPGLALRLSVNTSGEELRDMGYVAEVEGTLALAGLDPGTLQIEVTESIFLEQPEVTGAILSRLRGMGVRIALDDFGTGYSSLSYLDRYEMDTVKIDRSFVMRMLDQPKTAAIVEMVVRLGQAMALDVVAEGVEEEVQLQALQAAGCSAVQGYLLGRPAPAAAITQALRRQAGAEAAGG